MFALQPLTWTDSMNCSAGWCQTVTPSLLYFLHQELYERCDKLKRSAFKMATEAEDNDANLGLLLAGDPLPGWLPGWPSLTFDPLLRR